MQPLLAVSYTQELNPLKNIDPFGSPILSTIVAALPVVILFYFLVVRGWLAPKAGAMGAAAAILIAIFIYGMPVDMTCMSFLHGVGFGLMPIGWTVFAAMLLYNITVETGQFTIIRRSVASLSGDARIQVIMIGFAFGAFLEGAAGAGSPVAICGAMLVGLGFPPLKAAIICLIANTSPVCYGGLGVPILTLQGVTDIPGDTISVMCGHQLPFLSCLVPLYMVKMLGTWKQTWEVWPALVVGGGSFALFQYFFATAHSYLPGVVLWPMTDIGGGIFSLVVMAIFLRFWKPKNEWHYERKEAEPAERSIEPPLTAWSITRAWSPFIIMSVLLMLSGLMRTTENKRFSTKQPMTEILPGVQTRYDFKLPGLDGEVLRAERLRKKIKNEDGTEGYENKPESAVFTLNWLTAPGTSVMIAAFISMLFLGMKWPQVGKVFKQTVWQMRVPIPTIAVMLGLSYVTRYAGIDATLGVAFAGTGLLYPFFAAILGWLGCFLTGTDAGSNALFGSLQKITATEVYNSNTTVTVDAAGVETRTGAFSNLSLAQAQTIICTANSTGGVMGKMIDAQSICVATAGTNQIGKEAEIFKGVIWHSMFLAAVVGLMTLIQTYVYPFTLMVPK